MVGIREIRIATANSQVCFLIDGQSLNGMCCYRDNFFFLKTTDNKTAPSPLYNSPRDTVTTLCIWSFIHLSTHHQISTAVCQILRLNTGNTGWSQNPLRSLTDIYEFSFSFFPCFLETGSHVAQVGMELDSTAKTDLNLVLLSLLTTCCDYRRYRHAWV